MGLRYEVDIARLRKRAPKPYTPKTPEEEAAYALRKTFMGEDLPPRAYATGVSLTKNLALQYIGSNESTSYTSNKWKGDKMFEEFKHVSESRQRLFAAPGALARGAGPAPDGSFYGPIWRPADDVALPTVCAELSVLLHLEARLFMDETEDGEGLFGKGNEGCARIQPAGCLLYGAYLGDKKKSGYGEPCLLVISKTRGLQFLITGSGLDVTKDGIVG